MSLNAFSPATCWRRTVCHDATTMAYMLRTICPAASVVSPSRWQSTTPPLRAFALTSPQRPLPNIFRATLTTATAKTSAASGSTFSSSSSAAKTADVLVHTGYRAAAPSQASDSAGASSSASSACATFAVTDVKAFEDLIHSALHVTPVTATTAPPPRGTAGKTTTSSIAKEDKATAPSSTLLTNHTVRELQALLAAAELALDKPAARKAEIDRYVSNGYLPLLKYGTFALLSIQFVVYFNWIFFVFDWNLVEPTTYFLGYTGVFCSLVYHYYRCGEDDFTWKNLFEHLAHREAEKMYAAKKVDAAAVAKLQRRVADIKAELARVTV